MADVELDMSGLERILAQEPGRAEDWLNGFAEDMVTRIKLDMGTSPPGLAYPRGATGVHIASQPGYPPNVDIGSLIGSIWQEQTGRLEHTISDGVEHGIMLEDGTEAMLPRPFMRPAFDDARQRVEGDARRNLKLE